LDGQLRLIADWILDAFLPRDITQLRLFHEENIHREHFEPGEKVFDAGDVGDKVYFIAKGEAAVFRDDELMATLSQGEMFGEAALVYNHPRNATVCAKTALDVVVETVMSKRMGAVLIWTGKLQATGLRKSRSNNPHLAVE
jgi:hypothetical protein